MTAAGIFFVGACAFLGLLILWDWFILTKYLDINADGSWN